MTDDHDQHDLVSVLYSVHNELRKKRQETKGDDEEWKKVWKQHTSDQKTLQEYSKAMHELATKIWDPRNKTGLESRSHEVDSSTNSTDSKKLKCRLEWVVQHCVGYFNYCKGSNRKLKLLDVGSCYNPFAEFEDIFEIIPLDLCPAPGFENIIFQCDFTEVIVDEKGDNYLATLSPSKSVSCVQLPANNFDVVVFSYFLEYLPDTKQRQKCCEKAYHLLTPNGLLFILRPDSSKVTPSGNNVLIKKLKVAMVLLGFRRIYFEKLKHLWCMAFRKMEQEEKNKMMESSLFKKDVEKVKAEFALENEDQLHELFCIAQDRVLVEDNLEMNTSFDLSSSESIVSEASKQDLLQELPCYDF